MEKKRVGGHIKLILYCEGMFYSFAFISQKIWLFGEAVSIRSIIFANGHLPCFAIKIGFRKQIESVEFQLFLFSVFNRNELNNKIF